MILGLRTAKYHAPPERWAEAKEFYTRVTGSPPYFDESFYVGFQVGGFELGLVPDGPAGAGGSVPYWGVDDIAAEYARLQGLGATAVEPPTDVGEGIVVAVLIDPFGNQLGLIQNPYFDAAAVR